MSKIIKLKIDVTKIDKAALYKGAKGTYLDATFFLNDEADQYGNHGAIYQDISKERRDAGEKGAILGNGKVFRDTTPKPIPTQSDEQKWAQAPRSTPPANISDDEIPF